MIKLYSNLLTKCFIITFYLKQFLRLTFWGILIIINATIFFFCNCKLCTCLFIVHRNIYTLFRGILFHIKMFSLPITSWTHYSEHPMYTWAHVIYQCILFLYFPFFASCSLLTKPISRYIGNHCYIQTIYIFSFSLELRVLIKKPLIISTNE